MNNEKDKVKESQDQPRKVSTCFEELPGAELIQNVLGEHGIGSLSGEVMKSLTKADQKGQEDPQIKKTGGMK